MALSQPQPLSPPPTSPNATLNNFTVEFAVPALAGIRCARSKRIYIYLLD